MVPTFSWESFFVDPLPHQQPERNGSLFVAERQERPGTRRVYRPDTDALDRASMGAIPAAVLAMTERVRGDHPLASFSAVGPLAAELISRQAPLRVNGSLEALTERDGCVVLMGVGLDCMTLLHLAEQVAGRNMFRRWANGLDGQPMEVAGRFSIGATRERCLISTAS
jgi:aminoglycoside 3-N-acetyltransferase